MEALIGSRSNQPRINPDAVEFALDLTPEAIILHERAGQGGWRKFAAAELDDPEFPMVIGLLRAEAEAQIGGREPVRLWLPGEQVLMQRTRIGDGPPAARQRAAFDYIERKTVYRPEDVAVAVAPADRDGHTALLITFAETWREARGYATRWGFIPGEVSTRHRAGDFGSEGPVFRLNSEPPERTAPPSTRRRRNRLAVAALALAAVAAGAAVWSLRPWETPSGRPATALEIAEVAAAPRSPAPEPPQAAPPGHFPDIPVLAPPGDTGQRPGIGPAPQAASPPAVPDVLAAPAALAAAPRPPPDPEPAPPERDPVTAWTGPVPALEPPALSSPPGAQVITRGMDPPARVDGISLLARSASPPAAPVAAPPAEPATTAVADVEPAGLAAAAPPAPVPLPRPARTDPDAPTVFASPTSPLPTTRPARSAAPGLPLARTALIGIHSLGTGRKALLRLANGHYRSVIVGDVLEGWRVSMIGTDAMRISRSGEDRTFPLVNR